MKLDVSEHTLDQLLSVREEQFVVPLYQRPYSWTTEEVDQLWEDIAGMVHDEHFMGSVVLNDEHEDRPEVIDGQQRLTTLVLILALIRDEYHKLESKYVGRPQDLLVADKWADESNASRWKLRVGEVNWPVFRDFFLRPPYEEGRRNLGTDAGDLPRNQQARNNELLGNARRLSSLLQDYLGSATGEEREARLLELEEKVTRRLKFVSIRVGNVEDAFLLFETLNDRGLQLSAADLVKSHLLARFESENGKERVPEAAADWSDVIESLKGADIGRFLRYFLLMYYEKVQKDQVFRLFKKRLAATTAQSMLQHLRTMARYYGEFTSPEIVDHTPSKSALEDLADLRATTCYVALLPARHELRDDLDSFARFARITEALAYRWTTIVGQNAQQLETIFQNAASQFVQHGAGGLQAATKRLVDEMPAESEFLASFSHKRMGTQYVARYTLRRIDSVLRTSEFPLGPSSGVHLEHIMPQHLSEPWKEELGDAAREKHTEYVDRWGNLTLLDEKLNRDARDSAFEDKKEIYVSKDGPGSMIRMTQFLNQEPKWSPREIENRQKWLGIIAEQLWHPDGIDDPKSIEVPPYPYVDPGEAEQEIRDLIAGHETGLVEFKSTARINTHTGARDVKIESEVINTIAAFSNSDGGTLLIGVQDDGSIYGVEVDYKLFKGDGRDALTRWITDVIKDRVDPVVAKGLIVTFVEVDEHDACRVDVPAVSKPVFVREKGSDSQRFFVRMNNATHELQGQALLDYQKSH